MSLAITVIRQGIDTKTYAVHTVHLYTHLTVCCLSFSLTPDATFLCWRKEALVVAPLYSGVVQVFNTKTAAGGYEEGEGLVGGFRKIDAIAVYENLVATAETRTVK